MKIYPLLLCSGVVALLSTACSTTPVSTPPPVEDAGTHAPVARAPVEQPRAQQPAQSSAAHTLLAQASSASAGNDHQTAIVYLERAIRLEPRNVELWAELAAQYLAAGDTPKANQYARKAIALAGSDPVQMRRAWLVMADVKEAEGAFYEAQSIRRRYRSVAG